MGVGICRLVYIKLLTFCALNLCEHTGGGAEKNKHRAGSAKRKRVYSEHKNYQKETSNSAHPCHITKITSGPVIEENTPAFEVGWLHAIAAMYARCILFVSCVSICTNRQ